MSKRAEKEKNRRGVLLCGAYGMSNAGDEAILEAVLGEMRSIDADMPITVLSRTPRETAEKHGVRSLYTFDVPGFLREMGRCRLFLNGGGSLIQDATSTRSLWYYLFTLWAARRRGCRVLMYGCGIGPVSRPRNRRLTSRVLNSCVDAITLREANSLEELRSFGVDAPEVLVASDPAMTLSPAPDEAVEETMRRLGLDPTGRYIAFCLRPWTGFEQTTASFAAAADYAWEHYGLTPVFLPVNIREDTEAARAVAEQAHAPCLSVTESLSAAETIGIIARMQAVVSIRLHALIFAASQAVPIAGVAYDPKVSAFLDSVAQGSYIAMEDVSTPALCALVDEALREDRERLRSAADRLREIESGNTKTARRLLEE